MFIPMIYSCDAAILDEKKELKINVVYYKLQLEGGPNIPLTCSNVQLVFGIPPSGRKLVLDTHCIHEGRVPSIIEIEDLMVEIKNATEFHRLFIIFVCATLFALTMCLESHHALWHAPPESLTRDVNWRQFLLDELMHGVLQASVGRRSQHSLDMQ
ncbi:hypothetical protein CK203_043587 [Vitis vinifera]|uniref:Uncharacterized protein n=1 Tax=Vitis vinifera TaxID=29760 RepID=A0A438HYS5_VITVI|nr:hypothetical protein CK203_043587 [Vitis vinifera]